MIKLKIGSATTIDDLQIELRKLFPFLKFEFFRSRISDNKDEIADELPASFRVANFTNGTNHICLDLDGDKKTFELKKDFEELGLRIIVYRRAGNVWVKTTLTEDWSLHMQNDTGRNFST